MAEGTTQTAPAGQTAADPKAATPAVDPKTGKPAVAAPAGPLKTIKVNGKDVQVSEAQYHALAQKGYFADKMTTQVDSLKKGTQGILEALKTPGGVLRLLQDKSLGNSPKAVLNEILNSDAIDDEVKETLSAWVYKNVVQPAKLSPEELEKNNKLSEYEKLKKQETERKQKEDAANQTAEVQKVYQAIRAEVVKQIKDDKTFPQAEGAYRQVIEKIRVMNKKGVQVTVESITKAIAETKKDHLLHQQALFDAIEDPEALIAFFGEARAMKISRALVARLKAKGVQKTTGQPRGEDGVREKTTEAIDRKIGRHPSGYGYIKEL